MLIVNRLLELYAVRILGYEKGKRERRVSKIL